MIPSRVSSSLRTKVTLAVVLPLIVVLSSFTVIQYNRQKEAVLKNLSVLASLSGQIINTNLRSAMVESDFDRVQVVLDTLGNNEEFGVVYLLNTDGEVIFAPESEGVGTQLDNSQAECSPCHLLPVENRPKSILVDTASGQRVFRSMQPIENSRSCAECHGAEDRIIGLLLIDIYVEPTENSLNSNLKENLIWGFGAILATVIVVNLVLDRLVLGRLEKLSTAIRRFGQATDSSSLNEEVPDELGRLAMAFNNMAKQVREREADVRKLTHDLRQHNIRRGELLHSVISAQEEERKRIARELHDELGQSLSGLAFRAEAMGQLLTSDKKGALEKLNQIRSLTKDTMNRMYDLIWDLRPSALDDMGLPVAIRMYAERAFDDYTCRLHMDLDQSHVRLSPGMEITVYRICQEALNNIVRHSEASDVYVTMRTTTTELMLEVSDNGCGFDLHAIEVNGHDGRGLGILGMHERALQHRGQIDIESKPGEGTNVRIKIPIMEEISER